MLSQSLSGLLGSSVIVYPLKVRKIESISRKLIINIYISRKCGGYTGSRKVPLTLGDRRRLFLSNSKSEEEEEAGNP